MSQMRREVLGVFKQLHRARQLAFDGDAHALIEARKEINNRFRAQQHLTDEAQIKGCIQLAKDVNQELRTNVIQAVEKEAGVFELRMHSETTRLENVEFNPDAYIETPARRRNAGKNTSNCCGGATGAAADVKP